MVRRGWSPPALVVVAAASLVALPACGGDDGDGADGPPTTAVRADATLPPAEDVVAGTGRLVLAGSGYSLAISACSLTPVTDPATGVTTDFAVDADDGLGTAVSVTRSTTQGDVPTVTETVTIIDATGQVLEANRAEVNGRLIDLLAEGVLTPLLTLDGDVVTGEGVFGPDGAAAGDPGLVEGSLVLRCPPSG